MVPTVVTLCYQKSFGIMGMRFYYQYHIPPVRQNLDNLDLVLLGTSLRSGDPTFPFSLHDKMSNLGVELNIYFGKK